MSNIYVSLKNQICFVEKLFYWWKKYIYISSIRPFFNLSIHLLIHPSMSSQCFTLNISLPQWVQVLSITSTHSCTYSTCTYTNFEVQDFISSKPQEGRWWIRDKLTAWSHACSLVCVSCYGSLTPGELVLPVTSRLVALMLWLQCLGLTGEKTVEITVQLQ